MMFLLLAAIIMELIWRMPIRCSRLQCDPTFGVATAAIMVAAGSAQAYSQVKQGQAQKRYYDYMADTARSQGEAQQAVDKKQAEIAEDVGSQQVKSEAIRGAEVAGMQRAALAGNNVSGSGSAQDIAIDSMRKTQTNEINLKYNADTKAWGFETEGAYAKWQGDEQGKQYNMAGKQALGAAKRQAAVTMLSTAASVATFGAMGGFSAAGTPGTLSAGGSFAKAPLAATPLPF